MVVTQRRNTTQRAAILQVLAGTDEFVSAQDLHSALRSSGSTIGLATVYRALQDMAGGGDLDTVRNHTGEVLGAGRAAHGQQLGQLAAGGRPVTQPLQLCPP